MNGLIYFFLSTAMINAAPYTAQLSNKHQQLVNATRHGCNQKFLEDSHLLKEAIHQVNHVTKNLTEVMLRKKVQNVFLNGKCSCVAFCEAGKVLSAYKAPDLGLNSGRDWRLPRILLALSKGNCVKKDKPADIPLRQLLNQIRSCAQGTFAHHQTTISY